MKEKLPKNIMAVYELVPKEYHKHLKKLIEFYYNRGIAYGLKQAEGVVSILAGIDPKEIDDYSLCHNDDIDGG